eukprot:6181471-Pleurochrysis_carterae.AAC.9
MPKWPKLLQYFRVISSYDFIRNNQHEPYSLHASEALDQRAAADQRSAPLSAAGGAVVRHAAPHIVSLLGSRKYI